MTEGYTETKEITTKLFQPYKISFIPFAKGHAIKISANLTSQQIDVMLDPDTELVELAKKGKKYIEEHLNSRVLSVEKEILLDGTKLEDDQKVKKK